jgi:hypothetical protein
VVPTLRRDREMSPTPGPVEPIAIILRDDTQIGLVDTHVSGAGRTT